MSGDAGKSRVGASAAPSRHGKPRESRVTMAHGGGGKAMRDLIEGVFVAAFDNPMLSLLEDQAILDLEDLNRTGDRLAFTTDTYVVTPLFFPGGDIGSLAVHGTVNDLAMCGATPLALSCGFVLEEGLSIDLLRQVAASMARAADASGVSIVTGDTKVVERGAADGLFVNTSGIGVVPLGVAMAASKARPGDVVLVNGPVGDHGVAVLIARNQLQLEAEVYSDSQPLAGLVAAMLAACPGIHCMRDATRGGIATVLNEFASASGVAIRLRESALPVREEVRGACEILGLDPLYLANEGRLVAVVPREHAPGVLAAMRTHPAGLHSAIVGEVEQSPSGVVILQTSFGGERIVDLLVGEQLPRIC